MKFEPSTKELHRLGNRRNNGCNYYGYTFKVKYYGATNNAGHRFKIFFPAFGEDDDFTGMYDYYYGVERPALAVIHAFIKDRFGKFNPQKLYKAHNIGNNNDEEVFIYTGKEGK